MRINKDDDEFATDLTDDVCSVNMIAVAVETVNIDFVNCSD